jgi:hypothetical protein
MRQILLRLVCDDCGYVAHFETANYEPLTATLVPQVMVERHGWFTGVKEGSSFATYDRCPACVKREDRTR